MAIKERHKRSQNNVLAAFITHLIWTAILFMLNVMGVSVSEKG